MATLANIIENKNKKYAGKNLNHYFKILFFQAKNRYYPFHNIEHMLHVTIVAYHAGVYYKLKPRQFRNLLIAAFGHDLDHYLKYVEDVLNIKRAIRGVRKCVLPEDKPHLKDIEAIMRATQYPYTVKHSALTISEKIIRDADRSQLFSPVWIQQILFGLSAEMKKTPLAMLKEQKAFLKSLEFATAWGRRRFMPKIPVKLLEVKQYLRILK